jgi:hypothetical protein
MALIDSCELAIDKSKFNYEVELEQLGKRLSMLKLSKLQVRQVKVTMTY